MVHKPFGGRQRCRREPCTGGRTPGYGRRTIRARRPSARRGTHPGRLSSAPPWTPDLKAAVLENKPALISLLSARDLPLAPGAAQGSTEWRWIVAVAAIVVVVAIVLWARQQSPEANPYPSW
jgi:hypothetical protein